MLCYASNNTGEHLIGGTFDKQVWDAEHGRNVHLPTLAPPLQTHREEGWHQSKIASVCIM